MIHREKGVTKEGPFCGTDMPDAYGPSSESRLSIMLHTDGTKEFRGFSAEWEMTCRDDAGNSDDADDAGSSEQPDGFAEQGS